MLSLTAAAGSRGMKMMMPATAIDHGDDRLEDPPLTRDARRALCAASGRHSRSAASMPDRQRGRADDRRDRAVAERQQGHGDAHEGEDAQPPRHAASARRSRSPPIHSEERDVRRVVEVGRLPLGDVRQAPVAGVDVAERVEDQRRAGGRDDRAEHGQRDRRRPPTSFAGDIGVMPMRVITA